MLFNETHKEYLLINLGAGRNVFLSLQPFLAVGLESISSQERSVVQHGQGKLRDFHMQYFWPCVIFLLSVMIKDSGLLEVPV